MPTPRAAPVGATASFPWETARCADCASARRDRRAASRRAELPARSAPLPAPRPARPRLRVPRSGWGFRGTRSCAPYTSGWKGIDCRQGKNRAMRPPETVTSSAQSQIRSSASAAQGPQPHSRRSCTGCSNARSALSCSSA
ncbi:MAG: hypothetical protein AMJ64_14285 [Betaproteobacteria bacterium SG8_39]|nr:MAG: hypothetical protein AMJ64_14285 [Betaproteobacteria bacterium SG8_39]